MSDDNEAVNCSPACTGTLKSAPRLPHFAASVKNDYTNWQTEEKRSLGAESAPCLRQELGHCGCIEVEHLRPRQLAFAKVVHPEHLTIEAGPVGTDSALTP